MRRAPKYDDILTPREWQVLELLRLDLTNEEIAEKMGISFGTAKYHVGEILSKLGVGSREEAVAWADSSAGKTTRRFGFGWTLSQLGFGRHAIDFLIASKALSSTLVLSGITVTALAASGAAGEWSSSLRASGDPSATTQAEAPECQRPGCFVVTEERTEIASLAEAAQLATFEPRLPSYIPAEFDQRSLRHSRPQFPFETSDPYYDLIWASYRSQDARYLTVKQGYYHVAPTGWYDLAPEGMKGTVLVGEQDVKWVRGGPKPIKSLPATGVPVSEGWDDGGLMLFWTISQIETGNWEISLEGQYTAGARPLEYLVASDALPLEELVKIAESVDFE